MRTQAMLTTPERLLLSFVVCLGLASFVVMAWRLESPGPREAASTLPRGLDPAPVASLPVPAAAEQGSVRVSVAAAEEAFSSPSNGSAPSPPRKEKDFYLAYRRAGAADPAQLEHEAEQVLTQDVPDCQKVALLRALQDCGAPRAIDHLVRAATALPDASRPEAISVPRFALGALIRRAPSDAAAREALETIAWSTSPPAPDGLRRSAAAAWASVASGRELARLEARLSREQDPLLRSAVLVALPGNPDRDGVSVWFGTVTPVLGPAQEADLEE